MMKWLYVSFVAANIVMLCLCAVEIRGGARTVKVGEVYLSERLEYGRLFARTQISVSGRLKRLRSASIILPCYGKRT